MLVNATTVRTNLLDLYGTGNTQGMQFIKNRFLRLSIFESFRPLKLSNRVENFRTLKLSNRVSFRALKLSKI